MKTLKTLVRETNDLARYLKKGMLKEVSQTWLWTSQNAFLSETDPSTGKKWPDRRGIVQRTKEHGKYFNVRTHVLGSAEQYLRYKKLHRTGRLLRGLKSTYGMYGRKGIVALYNNVEYAEVQDTGKGPIGRYKATVRPPLSQNGTVVHLGVKPKARPFMRPSKYVLNSPARLLKQRMKSYGWLNT